MAFLPDCWRVREGANVTIKDGEHVEEHQMSPACQLAVGTKLNASSFSFLECPTRRRNPLPQPSRLNKMAHSQDGAENVPSSPGLVSQRRSVGRT